ncbi:hypothetical protein O3M35_003851 [Rhynocoris fuscipes]|uniref:E3 ubiquitin-protein ligase RNF170 n=1 Tax=Rhynocoris fuscipes TaxID=488301 RepID=A0AAW1CHR3_9HEMI
MPVIEGIDDEVIVTGLVFIATLIYCLVIIYRRFFRYTRYTGPIQNLENRQPPSNEEDSPEHCSICWNFMSFALETDCNHSFCGSCLMTLYHYNLDSPLSFITCPLCRSEVSLLFTMFSETELMLQPDSESGANRDRIVLFARTYNSMQTWSLNSLFARLREVPVLFRHYLDDVYNGRIFVDGFVHAIRFYFMLSLSIVYLWLPHDLIPETIFGALGFIDDILFFVLVIVYLAFIYRRFIMIYE